MNVAELVKVINEITPLNFAFDDDKVGLLIWSEENDVSGILVAHDLENAVLEQLDKENISYQDFQFDKKDRVKKNVIMGIDF